MALLPRERGAVWIAFGLGHAVVRDPCWIFHFLQSDTERQQYELVLLRSSTQVERSVCLDKPFALAGATSTKKERTSLYYTTCPRTDPCPGVFWAYTLLTS